MKTRKQFNIERVREFCKLVNEGNTPAEALREMNSCNGYMNPLRQAGLFWKEKDGTYKAVERIHTERYLLFTEKKNEYNNEKINKKCFKQATLFNQPKPKTGKISSSKNIVFTGQTMTLSPAPAPTMKAKKKQLSFIQRVVKSLFNL